jgi:hypothetical protein
MLLPTRHFRASTPLEYFGCEYSCFALASNSTVPANTEDVIKRMARIPNSKWPLEGLKALGRCASATGRDLGNWLSRTAASLFRSRKKNGLYLLYTEHAGKTGLRNIQAALDPRFPGYTIDLKALGRYKGQSENSAIIHVLTHDRDAVRNAAAEICEKNKQQTVLCLELPVTFAEFVTAKAKSNRSRVKRAGATRSSKTRTPCTSRKRAFAGLLSGARFAAGRNRS